MSGVRSLVVSLAALGVMAVPLSQPSRADVVTVNPEAVPTLAPLSVHVTAADRLPGALEKRFGLAQPWSGFSVGLDENPNLTYRRSHPYPTMLYQMKDPFGPLRGGPGVVGVEAYHYHWPWPPPNPNSLPPEEKVVVWRWNVPGPLVDSYRAWAHRPGKERHAALCLYPPARPVWDRDPIVFLFDALSGLLWQRELPARSTPLPPCTGRIAGISDKLCVFLAMTSDGARILALVNPKPSRNACVLFVLNGRGEITRTLVFPDRLGRGQPTSSGGYMRRSPSGTRFLLHVDHIAQIEAEDGTGPRWYESETYLIDGDGNLLCRFVDERGRPALVTRLGDAYAAGVRHAGGEHHHLIYRLPKEGE